MNGGFMPKLDYSTRIWWVIHIEKVCLFTLHECVTKHRSNRAHANLSKQAFFKTIFYFHFALQAKWKIRQKLPCGLLFQRKGQCILSGWCGNFFHTAHNTYIYIDTRMMKLIAYGIWRSFNTYECSHFLKLYAIDIHTKHCCCRSIFLSHTQFFLSSLLSFFAFRLFTISMQFVQL